MPRDLRVWLGGGFILLLVVVAIFAPLISPFDPAGTGPDAGHSGPGHEPGAGSARTAWAATCSPVGPRRRDRAAVAFIAATWHACSAPCWACSPLLRRLGRCGDLAPHRHLDAFPPVLLSILQVAVLGSGLFSVIVAIVVIDWTRFARVVRAETLQQARLEYVEAATALGMGRMVILLREILPNVLPVVLVLLSLEMGIAVIVEAILSFVGLLVSTDTPTWGGMIAEGRQIIYQPGGAGVPACHLCFLTVLASTS